MADYNSPNTGMEIDAAVAATKEIMQFNKVWDLAPTTTPIAISSLPTNADGNHLGIYDVVISEFGSNPDNSGSTTMLSRLYVGNEAAFCSGSATTWIDNSHSETKRVYLDGGLFNAIHSSYQLGASTATQKQIYICEIYRLDKIQ